MPAMWPMYSPDGVTITADGARVMSAVPPSAPTETSHDGTDRLASTAYQLASTQGGRVYMSCAVALALTLVLGGNAYIVLETATDIAFTANVREWGRTGISGSSGLVSAPANSGQIVAEVPPMGYWRYRKVTGSGTPTFTIYAIQEVLC